MAEVEISDCNVSIHGVYDIPSCLIGEFTMREVDFTDLLRLYYVSTQNSTRLLVQRTTSKIEAF